MCALTLLAIGGPLFHVLHWLTNQTKRARGAGPRPHLAHMLVELKRLRNFWNYCINYYSTLFTEWIVSLLVVSAPPPRIDISTFFYITRSAPMVRDRGRERERAREMKGYDRDEKRKRRLCKEQRSTATRESCSSMDFSTILSFLCIRMEPSRAEQTHARMVLAKR